MLLLGEAAADSVADTGYDDEVHEHYANDIELFYQDVPADLAAEALRRGRRQSDPLTRDPWPLEAWPTCQRGSSSAATTGSCLLRSCAVSSRTGSALRLTRSMPGIALRLAARRN